MSDTSIVSHETNTDPAEAGPDYRSVFAGVAGTRILQALVDDHLATIVPIDGTAEHYQRAEGARVVVLDLLEKAGRRLTVSPLAGPRTQEVGETAE